MRNEHQAKAATSVDGGRMMLRLESTLSFLVARLASVRDEHKFFEADVARHRKRLVSTTAYYITRHLSLPYGMNREAVGKVPRNQIFLHPESLSEEATGMRHKTSHDCLRPPAWSKDHTQKLEVANLGPMKYLTTASTHLIGCCRFRGRSLQSTLDCLSPAWP